MRSTRRGWALLACVGLALLAVDLQAQAPPQLQVWIRDAAGTLSQSDGDDAPISVGSLQKPFVAQAWAAAHPGATPPVFLCRPASGCWLPSGHGDLGLPRAVAVSCNAYFRNLAAATPPEQLGSAFRAAGFLAEPRTPEEAIGLPGSEGPIRIRPSALLASYAHLVREPWITGESVRAQVLAGLREAALDGTARGLGHRGFWAKTGTVPASDGNPLRTCGLALAVDDTGWAILARREPGTGREAAAALAGTIARLRPWAPSLPRSAVRRAPVPIEVIEHRSVRVRMFDLLSASVWEVRNLGPTPIPAGPGYLGPGGARMLNPGDQIGPGMLELRLPGSGLRRRFRGRLVCEAGPRGALRLVATLALRDYASGVVAAEAPGRAPALQAQLAAAVIRFLARGPRHADADVCDQTHCAWFIGEGPRLRWTDAHHAVVVPDPPEPEATGFTDRAWASVLEAARQPGPAFWTAHCGGEPLSPHAVWGLDDRTVTPCPRHGLADATPWHRTWSTKALAAAFGGKVEDLTVEWRDGTWTLEVRTTLGSRALSYDNAHRALALALGWNALPSPADWVKAVDGGYRATGRGFGHRVGLCLGN